VAGWYPDRDTYFARLRPDRPISQGDIFRGVPTVFVGHPAARAAAFAEEPAPSPQEAERPLLPEQIRASISVLGSYSMVLPHPCDFSEAEKGASHSVRHVARLDQISRHPFTRKQVEAARVHHTIWVPDWERAQPDYDWFVDLRSTTAVDAAYLNPARRVAVLSGPAWIAVMRRLAHFYTRHAIDVVELAFHESVTRPDA
jgi:hypothetical protein